jgi:hypothetical protein
MSDQPYTLNTVAFQTTPLPPSPSMPVPVMQVGIVGMGMHQWRVRVFVRVRLGSVPIRGVRVPVMFVVHVRMRVGQQVVCMLVLVPFAQVQPDAGSHASGSDPE